MTATFTNENKPSSGIRFGSANLTLPPGFTVISVGPLPSCSGCTATASGGVVALRGLGLPPTGSVTVNMTVDVSGAAGCPVPNAVPNPTNSPCGATATVKQSTNFSGPPGTDLTSDPPTSAPYAVLAHVGFGA